MAAAATTDTLLENLHKSRLLSAEQEAELRTELSGSPEPLAPAAIAERLVVRQWITPWQAQMLLSGRSAFFLGKYKLLSLLGQGGMGSVFQAEQLPLGRIVALKVMADKFVKEKRGVARFEREIQAAAALNHPNIVAAYDADRVGKTHFLVMEYVPGRTLEDLIRQVGTLPVHEACDYIRQAAVGLQHAFERGMVHRDIKPSNLLLTQRPGDETLTVKILDMGLARFASESVDDGALTQSGQVLGTPDYIAPEQAQSTRTADIRADVFSLGCTLFRLLTGRLPFGGTTVMEKLMARGMHTAARVRPLRPDVPARLDDVIAKMLARNPAERYQTPADVARALSPFATPESGGSASGGARTAVLPDSTDSLSLCLAAPSPETSGQFRKDPAFEQLLQQLATQAAPGSSVDVPDTGTSDAAATQSGPSPSGAARRPPRSKTLQLRGPGTVLDRRNIVIGAGALIVVVALVVAVLIWQRLGATTLIVEWPESERKDASLEINGQTVALPVAGELRFRGSAGPQVLRATRAGYRPISERWTLSRGETKTMSLAWVPTPDTKRRLDLAAIQAKSQEIAKRSVNLPVPLADPDAAVVWDQSLEFLREHRLSPEGLTAAQVFGSLPSPADGLQRDQIDPVLLANAGGGKAGDVPNELVAVFGDSRLRHPGGTWCVAFSPDMTLMATGGAQPGIRIWNVADGRLLRTLTGHASGTNRVSITSDGRRVVARSGNYLIGVWDLTSGELLVDLRPKGNYTGFAASADGRVVALGTQSGPIHVWDTQQPGQVREFKYHNGQVDWLAISPDGKSLVSLMYFKNTADTSSPPTDALAAWDVSAGTTRWTNDTPRIVGVAMHPDGKTLAVLTGRTIEVWDTAAGQKVKDIPRPTNCERLNYSPDGLRLAAKIGNAIQIYEEDTWKRSRKQGGDPTDFLFTPDGQSIAAFNEQQVWCRHIDERGQSFLTQGAAISAVLSPDGRTAFVGHSDDRITVHDLATGRSSRRKDSYRGLGGAIQKLAVQPDGRRLAVASSPNHDANQELQFVDLDEPDERANRPRVNVGAGMGLRFTPDGNQIAVWQFDGKIEVFDCKSLAPLEEFDASDPMTRYEVFSADWSPDGTLLASGSWAHPKALRLWDAERREELAALEGHTGHVYAVAFTPDGKFLISGGGEGSIRMWDIAKRRFETVLHAHAASIRALHVSLDGRRLAAGSGDGTLVAVSIPDGETIANVSFPNVGGIRSVEWTPDARHVLSVNGDGTAFVVRLSDWQMTGAK